MMKKIYILMGCMMLLQLSTNLSAQVIFSEDFSSATGTTPPTGWTTFDLEGNGEVWAFDNPGGQTLTLPISDPAAIFDSDNYGNNGTAEEATLESPAFDASAVTGSIMLSFDHTFYDATDFGGTGAAYYVEVWDGTTWVVVLSGTVDTNDPDHELINITSAVNGANNAQVRFRWTGDWGYWWILDNVVVEEISCAPVSDLNVVATTSSSLDIDWTPGGSETDWNIEYGPVGFTPGTGTMGTATGTPGFSAGTLTANTSYDFYVQADCGGGDESTWIGPITGFTGYCEFEATTSDYYINNFSTTGGATSNISNLNSGIGANGYTDATAMTVSQFEGGPNVNFTVDFGMQNWYTFGLGIWVDWNGNMIFESSEQVFQSFGYQDFFSGSFNVPLGVAVGNYRMRVVADYNNSSPTDACNLNFGGGEAEDYTFEVLPIPSCLPVSDLEVDGETTNTIDISWTPGDSETAWNIEWGVPGFVPGTGAGLDSAQQTSTASFTVSGLDPATTYDIYVQAACSSTDSSYWTLVSGTTLCAPYTAPWSENFDAMTDVDYGLYPICWLGENGDWLSDDGNNSGELPNSGPNFVGIYYGSNDHLWTPEFQLTAGTTYEFSFMWAGDEYTGWNGSVVVNDSQSSSGETVLGTPFITPTDVPSEDYQKAFYCFTPTTSGVYSFGVKVSASFNPYFLRFDDFSLVERASVAGTNGTVDACQISGMVDLNDIVTINDSLGNWTFAGNPSAIVNDTMFNPQFVPTGIVSVDYITYGCLVDTASALVTVYPPSSAGLDGSITACKNEPIDLHSALGGSVDMGGDWYNPNNNPMPNSQVITGVFPGSFNYKYISGNGVCPNDSSSVVVTVLSSCDWLSVDENMLESVNLYPNPSTGLVYIESTLSTGSFDLVITDINGRVIKTGTDTVSGGLNTVDLNSVQRGTYFFKLSNENAEKVFRVVIQ